MKKNAILIGLGLLVVMVFVGNAARFYRLDFVDQMSSILYDYRLRLTMPRTVDDRIVILDIDEKKSQGRGTLAMGARPAGITDGQIVR